MGHRVAVALFDGRLTPALSLRFTRDSEEYWHGAIGGEGSMERADLLLGGSLTWRFFDRWWVSGAALGKLASLGDAATFDSPGTFSLAVGTTYDLWDTDDERRARGETIEEDVRIRRTERDGVVEFEKD